MEIKEIKPIEREVKTDLKVSGSKSLANRALIISALAKGMIRLKNVVFCEDTLLMIEALKKFNVDVKVKGSDIVVNSHKPLTSECEIDVGNAGTTSRFLTSFASLADGKTVIKGSGRMHERPIGDLVDGLRQLGVRIEYLGKDGFPPLEVSGPSLNGGLAEMKGNVSSQFLSSIFMTSPCAEKEVRVRLLTELTSRPYVDITIDVMRKFGAEVSEKKNVFFVKKQGYVPREYEIEPDASSAAYFLAAAAILGGKIKVNVPGDSIQADLGILNLLGKMGCEVRKNKESIELKSDGDLKALGTIDMNDMPDGVIAFAIVSAFANGTIRIENIGNLRLKECDRLQALENELRKLGVKVKTNRNSITICGPIKKLERNVEIETYNDHRIAMAFAILGLKVKGIRIRNPGCVNKSFPEFWKTLEGLR